MGKTVKIGILGCGEIAARFAGALAKSEDAELFGCAARNPEHAETFAKEHGGKAYASYAELLGDPEIQAVYIATVHTTHAEIARQAILAGKAVLCEKPFFVNSKDAREVIALAKERNVLIMEGFWTRTQPAYQKAMEWVRAGKIGELRLIRAAFCFSMPFNEETKNHRLWNPDVAGGAMWDAGVYPYEFVTGVVGEGPIELHATIDRAPTGVDRTVAFQMKFQNGVIADCMTSIGGGANLHGVIGGTEGYIVLHHFIGSRKAELYRGMGELTKVFEDPEEEGFVHEIAHFAELLRAGKTESEINPLALTLDFTEHAEELLK